MRQGKGALHPLPRYIPSMANAPEIPASPLLFEAVIVPHRSLSPRGVRNLLIFIAVASSLIALRFWIVGAWPVMAFSILEVGIVMWLLRLNARGSRASEIVLLSDSALCVIRTDVKGGRKEKTLDPAWLRIELQEAPGRVPRLLLVSAREREEVGASLGEEKKRELASRLREAIYLAQNPRFDNVQLRD
ncbi:MAG: DUF2244 domain-containing protein [Acetobacteraceae bacterium]|nr:DUF2244 domain-containing protein [Acetobacteraceae bacterium]